MMFWTTELKLKATCKRNGRLWTHPTQHWENKLDEREMWRLFWIMCACVHMLGVCTCGNLELPQHILTAVPKGYVAWLQEVKAERDRGTQPHRDREKVYTRSILS